MCCFSRPIEIVSDTNIFARANGRTQFLVYSMSYAAPAELAMVLPLPVPPGSPEDAVRFISLDRFPAFFDDKGLGFPSRMVMSRSAGRSESVSTAPKLKVYDVGDFEASFVPRLEDFDRLDERFRIPRTVWDGLPTYLDYGFAVFKLKGSHHRSLLRGLGQAFADRAKPGSSPLRRVHPMALEFPRRNPDLLYFPTVHIHDGEVHRRAQFDHMLYCQDDFASKDKPRRWERSLNRASSFLKVERTDGIVDPDRVCWRLPLRG